jgi:hypothetical protein
VVLRKGCRHVGMLSYFFVQGHFMTAKCLKQYFCLDEGDLDVQPNQGSRTHH